VTAVAIRTGDSERTLLGRVVGLAFLVRLLALVASGVGLVGERLTWDVLAATLLLAATSFVGLSSARALELVVAHPIVALADVAVVIAVLALLGVHSPLSLATLSTALLIGVLFRTRVSVLLGALLVVGYWAAASRSARTGADLGFFLTVGMPATYACLVAIGHSVRRIWNAQLRAERELSISRQNAAVADERTRLAREVHDSLAKSLQGLALSAAALPTWVDRDPGRAKAQAEQLASSAQQAVAEARTLLVQMRADELQDRLDDVLGRLVAAWAEQHDRPVTVMLEPVEGLDAAARYELLAAVREALENVRRHAVGATVAVRATTTDGHVSVEIADDGPGFDVDVLASRERAGHFGVIGMRERMAGVGGFAELRTSPGMGTTVRLVVPVTDQSLLPPAARAQARSQGRQRVGSR
jgi:signal transduction histidine kinase